MPDRKNNFCSKFTIKNLFRATVAKAESHNSLHTLFDRYLDHMLSKFQPNRSVQTVQNFELFSQKTEFKKKKHF